MALIVQKYGGTSVGDTERMKNVARRCIAAQKAGHDVVVVVSAMSGETNRLLKLVAQITDRPDEREQDVVVATGEQVSIGLVAMAIHAQGGKAVSFLGHQVRIVTDSTFSKARIKSIDAEPIRAALKQGKIVVVAGFQGVDETGSVTTLGRGGSDTTGVALAAALKADACEIYTDVDGVYTTDPNVCPAAKKLDRITYEEMLELASLGAKVLQIRSVEFAMKYKVPLWVKSSFTEDPGTLVCEEDASMEDVLVRGVAYDRNEAKITVVGVPDQPGAAAKLFGALDAKHIVVDLIVQNLSREGRTDVTFTVAKSDFAKAHEVVKQAAQDVGATGVEVDDTIAKVSIVGVGMRNHSGVAARMFQTLSQEGINIQLISTSEIKTSCVIHTKYTELAVRALHTAFGLDAPPPVTATPTVSEVDALKGQKA
ncbi:aspartate kinase [Corallococcus exiguus]|uniref:aspartate kinase n=1 Tax=Corallococcus TaxID=83461 RepID=UPI000E9FFAC5|nr:aspartate kinase [Corallococcus sp. CA041A]MBN8471044.1 aspartate kinase [Corallococcus exiguus]NRD62951.1 aspartate kinase [Corallococcus exiguus]RKH31356.1 aspartate kinase [Corallococcus sp. CA041A]